MRFHADLHVHSKYLRATSRDLEHLAHWAARKGIGVVATGDFTHPALDAQMADAVTFKYLAKPLSKDQLAELIRIPPPH
jgi:PHP family Zn ribbon phosphoesterase